MNRRRLLQLGAGAGMAFAAAAGTLAWLRPSAGAHATLEPPTRTLFGALANVLLDGSLPTDEASRRSAIDLHLRRVQQTIAGLPPHARGELAQLLWLLDTRLGRLALMGVGTPWAALRPTELVAALTAMRSSTLSVRRQVYLALRELTMASYFAEPGTWRQLGYPGPLAV
jgi:hypothetical protein